MTLLELLVAIGIFSLLAGAGYTGLNQGLAGARQVEEKRRFWSRLESVHTLIAGDLDQAAGWSPSLSGRRLAAFRGEAGTGSDSVGNLFRFSRRRQSALDAGPHSPYRRIAYRVANGTLYRSTVSGIGVEGRPENQESALITGLSGIHLRYLLSGDRWTQHWPQTLTPGDPTVLPVAVEMIVELADHGRYTWLFHVGAPR